MNKKSTILLLIAVVLIGGVVFYGSDVSTPTNEENTELSYGDRKVQEYLSTMAVVDDFGLPEFDTSDWVTYRCEKLGFEIKYPSDFAANQTLDPIKNRDEFEQITECPSFFGNPKDRHGNVAFGLFTVKQGVDAYEGAYDLNWLPKGWQSVFLRAISPDLFEKGTINGLEFVRYKDFSKSPQVYIVDGNRHVYDSNLGRYYTEVDGKLYMMIVPNPDDKYYQESLGILSTFESIK